jgi:hypothetical protein
MERETVRPGLTGKSERIVVDSIFDGGSVRLLRGKRRKKAADDAIGADAWRDEQEKVVDLACLEKVLAGELGGQGLREGDVLVVTDGKAFFERNLKRLVPRRRARPEVLVVPIDDSSERARWEIKKEFAKLVAMSGLERDRDRARIAADIEKKAQAALGSLPEEDVS